MPSITLEVPGSGDDITSALHATNYADLQALLNGGLDGTNLDDMGASTGQALIWNGSTWAPATLSSGPGDPVTSLPGSPVDKQQALLVDSLTAPTYSWLFQYESGISDANKWMLLGGALLRGEDGGASSTTSTTYVDAGTTASITVPRAGIYVVQYGATVYPTAGSADIQVSVKIGAAATGDTQSVQAGNSTINNQLSLASSRLVTAAASDVLKLQCKISTGTLQINKRWITAIPVRVA